MHNAFLNESEYIQITDIKKIWFNEKYQCYYSQIQGYSYLIFSLQIKSLRIFSIFIRENISLLQ